MRMRSNSLSLRFSEMCPLGRNPDPLDLRRGSQDFNNNEGSKQYLSDNVVITIYEGFCLISQHPYRYLTCTLSLPKMHV